MIYFDEPFLTVHWEEDAKTVRMEWKAYAKSEELRKGLNKGLELLTKRMTGRWLGDLRNIGVIGLADQKWSNEDWFPRAVKGGMRFMALVMPTSAISSMGVRNILNQLGDITIETRYFDNTDEALAWLKTCH
jgi:hypothetical protein